MTHATRYSPHILVVLVSLVGCATQLAATPQSSIDTQADPELAARFPSRVAGEAFPVETFRDEATLRRMGVDASFLEALAVDFEDVSVALGHRPMATATSIHLSTYAYRVRGVTEDRLAKYFIPVMEAQSEDLPLERTSVRGKEVWRPSGLAVAVAGNMLYVRGDTAYLIYGDRRDVADLLVAALP